MNTFLKLMTCERHAGKVWHPVGAACPACHPEYYPVIESEITPEPKVVYVEPTITYVVSHSQPTTAKPGRNGTAPHSGAVRPSRQSKNTRN